MWRNSGKGPVSAGARAHVCGQRLWRRWWWGSSPTASLPSCPLRFGKLMLPQHQSWAQRCAALLERTDQSQKCISVGLEDGNDDDDHKCIVGEVLEFLFVFAIKKRRKNSKGAFYRSRLAFQKVVFRWFWIEFARGRFKCNAAAACFPTLHDRI